MLAIDADPSSNLNAVLGMDLERTVGDIREDTVKQAKAGQLEAGVAKADLLDYEINACLEEGTGVDLLAMGRPEGPHCYCAANTMLRTIVDRIAAGYDWVVMDTEAGLEHISRRTTQDVDLLLVITDPTHARGDGGRTRRRARRRARDARRHRPPRRQPCGRRPAARARGGDRRHRPRGGGDDPRRSRS